MMTVLLTVYLISASSRKIQFYERLTNRAWSISRLFIDTYNYDVDRVRRLERNDPFRMQNEKISIIDYKNDIIYSNDDNVNIELPIEVLARIRLGKVVRFREDKHEVLGALYISGNRRFVVMSAATDIEGFAHLSKLGLIMIISFFISLAFFALAGWIYSGRALRPISDMIRNVEDISITSLNLRVPEGNGTDEIGHLALTFNRMLERLEKSFSMQKDFITNASHELRTPLTSINGQLEVLVMKDRSSDEYKTALVSVLDDIKSLIDLSNRLLLIARTSAEGPVNFTEKIRIDEILWQAREEMRRFKKDYKINISIDNSMTDTNQMMVTGDEYLIKVAVVNIIDNACKYSKDKTVNINLLQDGKWIEIIFRDKGIGIPENDLQKIFEPFYRSENAHTSEGSGIGLPLVNQIINNHNGSIEISSLPDKGTTVKIKLPIAS